MGVYALDNRRAGGCEFMKSQLYYATYDISEDRVRGKVSNALNGAGLTRIQYSVFCGPLNRQQKKDLVEKLKKLTKTEGSVYLIAVCETCYGKLTVIGKGFDKEYVTGDKQVEIF